MRRVYDFVGICFCLCSHLSLSSPLLLGHPPLHGASPLWPGWREESAGPAFLSASSFHLACLFSKQIFLFIYPRDSLWRSSLALPRFFPSSLSIFLLCRGLSLSSCLVFVARLQHLPTLFQRLWKKGNRECGLLMWQTHSDMHKAYSLRKIATDCMALRGQVTDWIKIKHLWKHWSGIKVIQNKSTTKRDFWSLE